MEDHLPSSSASNSSNNKNAPTAGSNSSNGTNAMTTSTSSANMTSSQSADGFRCEITNDSSFHSTPTPSSSSSSNRALVNGLSSSSSLITVAIHPTTGGHFDLQVNGMENVEHLKKMISKRLKVAKERICLLYKEKDLRDGSLRDNCVQDGSKIVLLPMVETGLLTQKPEQSVMQALESLSDIQVNDFLSGKAPLNLTMRLGDHMMFIQLQLSTVGTAVTRAKDTPTVAASGHVHHHHHHSHHHSQHHTHPPSHASAGSGCSSCPSSTSILQAPPGGDASDASTSSTSPSTPPPPPTAAQVDGSVATRVPAPSPLQQTPPVVLLPPVATGGVGDSGGAQETPQRATGAITTSQSMPGHLPGSSSGSGDTCPAHAPHRLGRMTHVTHLLDTRTLAEASRNLSQTLRHLSYQAHSSSHASTGSNSSGGSSCKAVDAEECSANCGSRRPGAIIESMHHHGHGVYSGTFSGTLNPALQDRHGHPKRDISTIVHILNDLLGATPQYRRQQQQQQQQQAAAAGTAQQLLYAPVTTTVAPPTVTSGTTASPSGLGSGRCNAAAVESTTTAVVVNKSQEEYSRLSLENKATRGKMEQLQVLLEERRARRRARRNTRAPYPPSWSTAAASSSSRQQTSVFAVGPSSSMDPMMSSMDDAVHPSSDSRAVATVAREEEDEVDNEDMDDGCDKVSTTQAPLMVTPVMSPPDVSVQAESGPGDSAVAPDTPTPMECDGGATSEGGLDENSATAEQQQYLKLNPETVVA